MKLLITIILQFLILLIAIFSGFELAMVSATGMMFGLTKNEWLIIHASSGSIIILIALIWIFIYRKWIIKNVKKLIKQSVIK